jgi:magnesium chelatase family protein
MRVQSLVHENNKLIPMEVELSLWPGLPGIQFLGLADQQIKESALRIKSAIKAQGFEFPRSQQILVNLRSHQYKKTSPGLELAVVFAYLLESQQVLQWSEKELQETFIYGSLSLYGTVNSEKDLEHIDKIPQNAKILTGVLHNTFLPAEFSIAEISDLAALKNKIDFIQNSERKKIGRPTLNDSLKWSLAEAEVLTLIAAGGHHALLAGPAGSGKSTMAKVLHEILPWPQNLSENQDENSMSIEKKIFNHKGWYPLAQPHHSVTLRGMIGGGQHMGGSLHIGEGEITRAHGGILFLDEFLEFRPEILEALREPLENGVIHLSRGDTSACLPSKFQLIATTNLCPCGIWTPDQKTRTCRFSRKRCYSYSDRLSGPLLDRFQILHFTWPNKKDFCSQPNGLERNISTLQLIDKVGVATQVRKLRKQRRSNESLTLNEIELLDPGVLRSSFLSTEMGSERRKMSTFRVARTLADLDGETKVKSAHLQKAQIFTHKNFQRLSRWE